MPVLTQRCARCEEVKPLRDYNNCAAMKSGKQSWCRDCSTANHRVRYQLSLQEKERCEVCDCSVGKRFWRTHLKTKKHYENMYGRPVKQEKACTRCETVLPMHYFYNTRTNRDGKASWCKHCALIDVNMRHRIARKINRPKLENIQVYLGGDEGITLDLEN